MCMQWASNVIVITLYDNNFMNGDQIHINIISIEKVLGLSPIISRGGPYNQMHPPHS